MTKTTKRLKRVLSVVLTIAIVLGTLPIMTMLASADELGAMADPSTAMSYTQMLGTDKDGNRYAGRVWVDKSVHTGESVSLDGFEIANDSDFLVTYSALGSSTSVTTEKTSAAKLDVVLVLDNSTSMRDDNKIGNMVTEANKLIGEIVGNDKDNRVAVVSYCGEPFRIAGLNHYDTLTLTLGRNNGVIGATGTKGDKATDELQFGRSEGWASDLSGTYTQTGINMGMQILLDNADKSRIPVVVVLTDGEANIAATGAWYDMDGRNASTHRIGVICDSVVVSTVLTGAYMKSAVENAYSRNAMVYGVSVGLGRNSSAYVVMDPATYFKADSTLNLGRTSYALYEEWKNSNSTVTETERSGRNYTFEFYQLPANDVNGVTKQQVVDNINYIDKHFTVESGDASLGDAFKDILETITTPAFNPITDTVIQGDTTSEVPLTYVDFIGEYMEVKELKAVTLFGKKYAVNKGSTVETFEEKGSNLVRTAVTTYKVGADESVTHPVFGTIFNVSKDIRIELTDVSEDVYENGTLVKTTVSEQTLRVYIESEALPAIVDNVKVDVDGKVTFTEIEAEPVRVYYTVGVSDDILNDEDEIDLSKVSSEYIAKNTVDGRVRFYANRFGEMNTAVGGVVPKGDAHVSFTPSDENRYYYHQNSFAVFSKVTDANGAPLVMDPQEYGVEHKDDYNYTFLSAADIFEWDNGSLKLRSDVTDDKVLYTYIEYYRPTYDVTTATTGEGELIHLLIDTTWGDLKNALTAVHLTEYDSADSEWKYEYAKSDMSEMTLDELKAYIETLGANYDLTRIRARIAKASQRVTRLAHMVEAKNPNTTGTAVNAYAPDYNTDAAHVGGIVVWLGNNGIVSVEAETGIEISKTVTEVADGDTTGEYTFTVTSSSDADKGKISSARFYAADGTMKTAPNAVIFNNNGVASVTLKDGEKVQIVDLEAGATYTVSENEHPLYSANVESFVLVPEAGTLKNAAFVNTPKEFGNITINKIVTHDFGAEFQVPDIEFEIRLTFKDPAGRLMANKGNFTAKRTDTLKNITTDLHIITDANGQFTTTIKHGEQIEIFGLEAGTTITGMELYNGAEYSAGAPWYPGFSAPQKWHDDENDNDSQVTINANRTVTAGFINDYNAKKADVNVEISGTKTFQGDWSAIDPDAQFTVYLQRYDAATGTWDRDFAVTYVSKNSPTYSFTDAIKAVTFDAPGTYLFQILEDKYGTTEKGITYDSTVHNFGVVVEADMTTDKLHITKVLSYHAGNTPVELGKVGENFNVVGNFTNIYDTNTATATFDVQKVMNDLVNSEKIDASGFTFTLYEAVVNGGVWSEKVGGNVVTSNVTDVAGEITFTMEYHNDGTYYYTVRENIPADADKIKGMDYDTTEYHVTVVVHDDGQGNLIADTPVIKTENGATVNGVPTFTNTYDPQKATVNFDVHKDLKGRTLSADEFEFTLSLVQTSASANGVTIPNTTVKNAADGTVDFGSLTFSEVGSYYFNIKETKGNLPGVTYDEKVYHIMVTVTDNVEAGKLEAEVAVYDNVGEQMLFTNTYAAKATDTVISTHKDLIGRDLNAGEFTFTLEEIGGDRVVRYGTNDADGNVVFAKIDYTKAGTYTYKLYENIGSADIGITWDERVYTITVVVTDIENGEYTGQLKATVTEITEKDEGVVSKPVFENKYNAVGSAVLNGVKYVDGAELTGTYNFILYASEDGIAKGAELARTSNAADGTFSFLRGYSLVDLNKTFYYIVEEEDAGKFTANADGTGIKNDTRYYVVKVTLTDNGKGTLVSDVTITRDNGYEYSELAFVNTYYSVVEKEVFKESDPTINIDGKSVSVGEVLEYAITYTNANETAMDVTVTDTVPAGTELVNGTAGDGVVNGNTITWQFKVNPGETKTVTFKVKVVAGGATIKNQAVVEDLYNRFTTNETESHTFEKNVSDTNGAADIEDKIGYSVQYVNNTGAVANVVISDKLDKGLTYVEGSATNNGTYADGVISWTFDNVQPGAIITVSFDAIVNHDADQKIDNTVSIYENGVEFKTNTVTTEVLRPELTYKKSQSVNGGALTTETVKAQKGDEIVYSISVTNIGLGVAKDVTVTDAFPNGLTILTDTISNNGTYANGVVTWNIAELAVGQRVTLSFKVIVNDGVGTEITNIAILTDDDDEDDTNDITIEILQPKLSAVKTQSVGGAATAEKVGAEIGGEVTYYITVNNTGAGAAKAITVKDTVPADVTVVSGSVSNGGVLANGVITWNIDTLAANAEVTVSFKVIVSENAVDSVKNVAVVTDDGQNTPTNEVETDILYPAITVNKTQSVNGAVATIGATAEVGDEITYFITVKNTGLGTAKDITVKDTVPNGVTLVDGSVLNGGVVANGVITWNIATIAAGAEATVSFKVVVTDTAGEAIKNVAVVTDDGEDKPTNETKTDILYPGVNAIKTQSVNGAVAAIGATAEVGDEITYFITVKNTGLGTAKDITVKDTVPNGVTLVDGSVLNGGVVANGVITWNIATIAAGAEATVSFKVVVTDTAGEAIKNVAVVTDDGEDKPTNETTTDILYPGVNAIKTQSVNGAVATIGATAEVGDEITYFITVKNTGLGTAKDITVKDTVPNSVTLVDGSVSNGGVVANGVITWNIATIAVGAEATVSFKVVVTDTAGEAIKNVAVVTDDGEDKPTNETTTDILYPGINATKAQAVGDNAATNELVKVVAGDKVTYFITVKNAGSGTAKDILVKDLVPAGTVLVADSVSNGGKVDGDTIIWNIAKLEAGDSVVLTFAVTVKATENVKVVNTAKVTDDGAEKDTNTVTAEVLKPAITATKTQAVGDADATDDKTIVEVGDKVTYFITVENVGSATACGITVKDIVSEHLASTVLSVENNGVLKDGTITWTIDSIEPGAKVTVSFTVELPAVVDNTVIKNTAIVVGDTDGDGDDDEIPTNEVEIEVHHPDIPETGDNAYVSVWTMFLILSAAGFVAINIFGKRKEMEE